VSPPAGIRRLWLATGAALALLLAAPAGALAIEVNKDFKPQNEFKLDPWIELKLGPVDMSINKAVFLLFLGAALTIFVITRIANRLQDKPNRVQTALELAYDVAANNIVRGNLGDNKLLTARWFSFIVTLFFFILFSNLIGLVPLPVDTEHKVDVFGVKVPQFALYGATANLSVPLVLTLVVWGSYHVEGIRAKGPIKYLAGWVPAGVSGAMRVPIFAIEAISHFVRLISLSVRLFANMLAGHMLILIMGGGMIILLGSVAAAITLPIGVAFYLFEIGLVAGLQAFIFATLTAIYLGGAVAEEH
jgi:F-type H+-transporting ATPase subunit a